jgi:hypothetical protein
VLTVVAPTPIWSCTSSNATGAHEAELYRAIGLKLRSVLTGTAIPEPPPRPPPAAPPRRPARAAPATVARDAAAPAPPRRRSCRSAIALDDRSTRLGASRAGDRRRAAARRLLEIDAGTELARAATDACDTIACRLRLAASSRARASSGAAPRDRRRRRVRRRCTCLWASASGDRAA